MALVAQPKIDQGALPPGVASQSRDDLAVGAAVTVSDAGPGTTRLWTLVDKPEGSGAVLTSSTGVSTQFTPDIEGSYMVRLEVDGAPSGDYIETVIAGVQYTLPSWVTSPLRWIRVPAWSEKLEFNVKSSPTGGANARGWAYEVNQFMRAVSQFAFGTMLKLGGVALSAESFRTINFVGGSLVDDGGGQATYTSPGAISGEFDFPMTSGEYSSATVPGFYSPPQLVRSNCTIQEVSIVRRTAGTAGATRVDLLVNGVSIFASDPAKPQVTAATGDNATDAKTVFTSGALVAGDILEVELETVETYLAGPPEGPEGFNVLVKVA